MIGAFGDGVKFMARECYKNRLKALAALLTADESSELGVCIGSDRLLCRDAPLALLSAELVPAA